VCVCVYRRALVYWPRCLVYLCVPIYTRLDTRDCRARRWIDRPAHVSVSHLADECRSIWFIHTRSRSYDDDWPADRSCTSIRAKTPSSKSEIPSPIASYPAKKNTHARARKRRRNTRSGIVRRNHAHASRLNYFIRYNKVNSYDPKLKSHCIPIRK